MPKTHSSTPLLKCCRLVACFVATSVASLQAQEKSSDALSRQVPTTQKGAEGALQHLDKQAASELKARRLSAVQSLPSSYKNVKPTSKQ